MVLNSGVEGAPASPRPSFASQICGFCSDLLEFVKFYSHDIAATFLGRA